MLAATAACSRPSSPVTPVRVDLNQQSSTLRLIVVGDVHTHGAAQIAEAVRRVNEEKRADAMLLVGDNFDPCGVTSIDDPQWKEMSQHLSPIGVPMFPVLGNHDYGNPKTRLGMTVICGKPDVEAQIAASRRVPNWKFPARNYIISTPSAEIIMTDTTPLAMARDKPVLGSGTADAIGDFVRNALRGAGNKWRIVAGHHNIRFSGKQRWKSAPTRRSMKEFEELLAEGGADLYVCGHQHQLELIVPRANGAPSRGQDTLHRPPAMLISGASWRPKKDDALTTKIERDSHFLSNSVGFATLELDATTFSVTFYDRNGQPMEGTISFERKTHERAR